VLDADPREVIAHEDVEEEGVLGLGLCPTTVLFAALGARDKSSSVIVDPAPPMQVVLERKAGLPRMSDGSGVCSSRLAVVLEDSRGPSQTYP
jgi:hypothetical protein